MKRNIFFAILFSFLASSVAIATTAIDLRKDLPPGPLPLNFTFFSVSATIDATELAVYFEESVGDATITVYDDSSNMVYQEVVDTDASLEVFISSSTWLSGDYTLTITYGTTNLIGDFQIE